MATTTTFSQKQSKPPLILHFMAGASAGLTDALTCHPFDTVKVRMQIAGMQRSITTGRVHQGPLSTAISMARTEGLFSLYKGIGAVVSAIVPKMAIRFYSFEAFKSALNKNPGQQISKSATFLAGFGSGIAETLAVVNPMEIVKIRLQSQKTSPEPNLKYKSVLQTIYTIVREEGVSALYKGASLTMARQATNQAINFTLYGEIKKILYRVQNRDTLPSYQHLLAGGLSGGIGPIFNAPIDTLKTRIQRQVSTPNGDKGFKLIRKVFLQILRQEGVAAFYSGLTPRLMRVAPGQAITFMMYEKASTFLKAKWKPT